MGFFNRTCCLEIIAQNSNKKKILFVLSTELRIKKGNWLAANVILPLRARSSVFYSDNSYGKIPVPVSSCQHQAVDIKIFGFKESFLVCLYNRRTCRYCSICFVVVISGEISKWYSGRVEDFHFTMIGIGYSTTI